MSTVAASAILGEMHLISRGDVTVAGTPCPPKLHLSPAEDTEPPLRRTRIVVPPSVGPPVG
eukprot:7382619-Prymnesium_polylepis.1